MCRSMGAVLVGGILVLSAPYASSAAPLEKLPERYRAWLEEEVVYIITDVEREAFLALETQQERDAFIEAFWRRRDTNPSTLENEYRERHYERLAYANEFLGRDTFRAGWMTDRGKYHILLGPPTDIQSFDHEDSIYPAELWFYNNPELKEYGLPPFFYLLFFRRHGTGELELYSPTGDGPIALFTGYQTQSMDFRRDVEAAYDKLWEISPELAQASLSFRTDEGDTAQFQSTAFGTVSLLDQIAASPFRGLDTSYAERFDFERGVVESDYLFSYVPSSGQLDVLPGPGNAHFLHWLIEIDPQHVAVVKDEDRGRYGSLFIISAEITRRDDPDAVLLQVRKDSFMNLSQSQVEGSLHLPFAYSGMIPLVPGSYDVRIILRNRACTGREEESCRKSYTMLAAPVEVPEEAPGSPRLIDPVLGYGVERPEGEPAYRPYRFGTLQFLPNPRRVYAIGEPVVVLAEALGAPAGSSLRFRIVHRESPDRVEVEKTVPAGGVRLEPEVQELAMTAATGGRYELEVALLGPDGRVVDRKRSEFDVTPRTVVARPSVRGSWPFVLPEVPGLVETALGEQYLALGRKDTARELFETAVSANARLGPAREQLASLLLEDNQHERVVELLEPVYREIPDRWEVLVLLGEAYFQGEDYARAAELLGKARVLRRPEPRLLNVLAVSQYRSGDRAGAKESLEQSLSIDPDQPEAKELLEKLRSDSGGG